MNVLMLCGEIPYPPHGGSRMRVYQFIRALAQRHRITLLALQHADDAWARHAIRADRRELGWTSGFRNRRSRGGADSRTRARRAFKGR